MLQLGLQMRLLICGDRNWDKPKMIERIIDGFAFGHNDLVIIEGCARGADKAACEHRPDDLTHEHYPALWDEHGKAAGPIRNRQMLKEGQPDLVIAFHNDISTSKGTKDMVKIAKEAGLPTYVMARQ